MDGYMLTKNMITWIGLKLGRPLFSRTIKVMAAGQFATYLKITKSTNSTLAGKNSGFALVIGIKRN